MPQRANAEMGNSMERHVAPEHEGLLARIGHACAYHPGRTIVVWLIGVAVVIGAVAGAGGKLSNDFSIPGSDSQKALDLLKVRFPQQAGDSASIVFAAPQGKSLKLPQYRDAVAAGLAAAKKIPKVSQTTDPYQKSNLSKDGRVAFSDVYFTGQQAFQIPKKNVTTLMDNVRKAVEPSGLSVEFTGQVISAADAPQAFGPSELIGIGVALIVLLVVLATFASAFIPLVVGIFAVMLGFMLLLLLARLTAINSITPLLLSMIGLGVGIDYSLLIVTRFRQNLHEGMQPKEAAAKAQATAGRAVVFAGTTVAISVAGLALIGLDFVTKLGIGGALGVLTSVAIAVTLLPAVLAKLGHRIDKGKVPGVVLDETEAGRAASLTGRWGRLVTRRPALVGGVAVVMLLALASPVLGLQLGAADAGTQPSSSTERKAYDLLADGFGAGFNGPILVVVDQKNDRTAGATVAAALKQQKGISFVAPAQVNKAGDTAIVTAFPTTSPQSKQTSTLVRHLRKVLPASLAKTNAKAYLSGTTAAFDDIAQRIFSAIPQFLLFVIGITFLVLAMAFRSLVIALKAALTTLLSALVSFGVLTFMVTNGHFLSVIGLDKTGPIESFLPPIAFAILFGLSMDYEVFLMSRIREEHLRGKPTKKATADGMSAIGRVIIAAALIMTSVFFAFALAPDRTTKEFGVFLGVAILTDALIMRMAVVPALLSLLGERSWAMPAWLDRILPNITIEPPGELPERPTAATSSTPSGD